MKFLVVDDHALITAALSALLMDQYPDVEVLIGSGAEEALSLAREHGESADLMMLDLTMPGVTGTELLERIVAEQPTLKILVLSGLQDQLSVMKTLQLGACGFIPKTLDTDLLTNAIQFVLKGGVYIPTKLLAQAQQAGLYTEDNPPDADPGQQVHLTDRQMDVLALLAKGAPIKRICRDLELSEGTVKTHVAAIYRAFGAANRTEALLAARRLGFRLD